MIKNIPIKFTPQKLLDIINTKFQGQFDYFYLPKDLKTQHSIGFAFINFIHAVYILDFYLEFNCVKWSDYLQNCNSEKYC